MPHLYQQHMQLLKNNNTHKKMPPLDNIF